MRRLVAFSLDGKKELPESSSPYIVQPVKVPEFHVDEDLANKAMLEYETICYACHGTAAQAAGMAPDLRASGAVLDQTLFANIVREGSRTARGMPAYKRYSNEELLALRHYIRLQAELSTAVLDLDYRCLN